MFTRHTLSGIDKNKHLLWCTWFAMSQELADILLLICHSMDRAQFLSHAYWGRFCVIHACVLVHLISKLLTLVPYQDRRNRISVQPNQSQWWKIKVAQVKVLRTPTGKLGHFPVRSPLGVRPLFAAFFIVWEPINGGDCKQRMNANAHQCTAILVSGMVHSPVESDARFPGCRSQLAAWHLALRHC